MLSTNSYAALKQEEPSSNWLKKTTDIINQQLIKATQTYQPGKNPRSVNPDGTVRVVGYKDWTTGFFPGSLWYGYELTGNKQLADEAKKFTLALDSIRYIKDTHDVGFMLY
ncbi:MAG: glucuronyl hydrolase, partial [Flavobacteriales bacterium]